MAYLYKTHSLFFVTSPRTPFKMRPEIDLLVQHFSGKPWNEETQLAFAKKLSQAPFFEGGTSLDSAFSARDRINRAPKAFGFVDLSPTVQLTEAGKAFLTSKRPHEIFTRQLLKFQLPSPYHIDKDTSRFFVKPYLELLRLIYELDGLSKDEISIFVLQLTHIDKYGAIKQKIIQFRDEKKKLDRSKTSYKRFVNEIFEKELLEIYAEEVKQKKFKTRESTEKSLKNFLSTKRRNHKDYTDASFRYLRATGLVTLEPKTFKLVIPNEKRNEIEFLLENVKREPIWFENEQEFKKYLFDSASPELLTDNKAELIKSIKEHENNEENIANLDIESLKDIRDKLIEEKMQNTVLQQVATLKTYKEYPDIVQTFRDIAARDVVDPSLMFEWNVWRAFTMLNDGKIHGNFRFDETGMPLSTAPGNMPDIICEYEDFDLLVEVTLSTGQKQYEMEGEPVPRHLGNHKKRTNKDSYCLFIANTLNPATLAHFFYLHKVPITYYGGTSKIIPMQLSDVIEMLNCAYRVQTKPTSATIKAFVQHLSKRAAELDDENKWYEEIKQLAKTWTSLDCAN